MIRHISCIICLLVLAGCFYGGATTTQSPSPSYSEPLPPPAVQPQVPQQPSLARNPDIDEAQQALSHAEQNSTVATQLPLDLERARAPLNEAEAIWKREKGSLKAGDEESLHIQHLAYIARQRAAIAEAKARSINALRGQPSAPSPDRRSALAPPPIAYVSPPMPRTTPQLPVAPAKTPLPVQAQIAKPMPVQAPTPVQEQVAKPVPVPALDPAPAVVEAARGPAPSDMPVSLNPLNPRSSVQGVVLTFGDEYFVANGTLLKSNTGALIDSLVQYLSMHPSLPVVCEGYSSTSPFGGEPQIFAEGRARSVQEALFERGVEFTRVSVVGYGSILGGANHRVDVVIKKVSASPA